MKPGEKRRAKEALSRQRLRKMQRQEKGYKNEHKRCKACKAKRAEGGGGGGGGSSPMRSETKTNCSQCGKETTVPFRPTQGRPVFCRECFQQRRAMGAA